MVHESYPWKQDLLKQKRLLGKYNTAKSFKRKYDVSCTAIEKAIFYSAFIIRKLLDCKGKLSDEADSYDICVKSIKPLKRIDYLHRWPKENSHDWGNEVDRIVLGRDICNWLIHSYLFFAESEDENGPMISFCVSSDYDRNKILYKVSIDDWIDYIEFIASDDIISVSTYYDEEANDFIYEWKKRG